MKPNVSIIAAIQGKDGAIGKDGKLLVAISDDLKRFRMLTTGHPIVMGRKTFESIGRPLPNRHNIVITRDKARQIPGTTVVNDLETAIDLAWKYEEESANPNKEIFVIGGGEIYQQALPRTNKLYLTIVESDLDGDIFFPDYSEFKKETSRVERFDEKSGLHYAWIDLER